MTVIYLTPEDKDSAIVHAKTDNVPMQSLDEPINEVSEILISGHTNEQVTHFGKISPLRLAEKLAANYLGDKSKLEHLYLLTCAAGLSINNKPSLAKQLVQMLVKKGFTNLKVHAPTSPVDIQTEDMLLYYSYSPKDIESALIDNSISSSLKRYRLSRAIEFLKDQTQLVQGISFFSPKFKTYSSELSNYHDFYDNFTRTSILQLPAKEIKEILQSEHYTFTADRDPKSFTLAYAIAKNSCGDGTKSPLDRVIQFLNLHTTCDFPQLSQNLKNEIDSTLDSDYQYWLKNTYEYLKQEYPTDEPQFPDHIELILNDIEKKMRLCYLGALTSTSKNQLIFELRAYIDLRSTQAEYCSVFILQGLSVITEWLSILLSFFLNECKSKTVKINAAEHLLARLDGSSEDEFSSLELKALKEGMLGSVIKYTHPYVLEDLIPSESFQYQNK